MITRFKDTFCEFLRDSNMFDTNTRIAMSISSSHSLIPFSSSFLPKINLEYFKKGSSFAVNLQVQNAKKEGFDPKSTFSVVHNKTLKDSFGCEVQVLAHKQASNFSLIVGQSLLVRTRRGRQERGCQEVRPSFSLQARDYLYSGKVFLQL